MSLPPTPSPASSPAGRTLGSSLAGGVESARSRLARDRRARVQGLRGPSRAAFLARFHTAEPRPLLVLCPTVREAEALAQDLRFFLGEQAGEDALRKRVHFLPAWDVAPFAPMSPSPETIAQRIEGLWHLSQTPAPIVVTTPEAALQRVMSPAALQEATTYLVEGDAVDLTQLSGRLVDWGYKRRPLVEDRGELAVRGGLLDVYVTGQADPIRLELMGDALESIRVFDPRSQRSLPGAAGTREEALILPAREFRTSALANPGVERKIEERAGDLDVLRQELRELIESVREGIPFPGLEALAPFFVEMVPLDRYLPATALVVLVDAGGVEAAAEAAWQSVEEHADTAASESRFHARPEDLYLEPAALRAALAERPVLELESLATMASGVEAQRVDRVATRLPFEVRTTRLLREESGFAALAGRIREWTAAGARTALVVGTAAQADRLRHILEGQGLAVAAAGEAFPEALAGRSAPGAFLVEGDLSESIELPEDGIVAIAELNLFGEHRRSRRRQQVALTLDQVMKSLEQIKPEDFIVHVDHGVGRYHGLRHLAVAGTEGDFLHLEYSGGDRLYLPVDRVNLVQKFVAGEGAEPALDKLGGVAWVKLKKKTKESLLAMAHELLALYATRSANDGHAFSTDDPYYQEFEARFPFDETPDQKRAIDEVLADLGQPKPMDRLVCGDVGYGKTEVAMRATFVCAMEGRQVAILVPTTVLAQQHTETLRRRFEGFPMKIDMVSSFRTKRENEQVLERVSRGEVDVVVGTHRLLQPDVRFARLGLLVVDEEHRFGVRDKERIKNLRKLVDVLTLTATPIPRTLEMSLTGIRDLSVIETPPLDRQAIRTYVTRFDDQVIREALLRELNRGGQAFFVHNRVESIARMGEKLRALVPEARIEIGHGQMREHQLEKVMLGFMHHDFDVLLCTAIVESGLDIPNANTILIDRADTFGLAQLYQLRGRVGRSPARAYAYLLIPSERVLTDDAKRRLEVLQELDELGGGFKIAAHDLEIRGAGNLLGKQQSGHINAVGFELYTQMMEEAVHELRGEPVEVEIEPEIQLGVPAYLPEAYVDDVNQRLVWYKRLAAVKQPGELDALHDELRDRYGPLPELAETLFEVMEIRRRMRGLKVLEARVKAGRLLLKLHESAPVRPEALVEVVRRGMGQFGLTPDGTFSSAMTAELAAANPLEEVRRALATLESVAERPAAAPAQAAG